MDIVITLLVFFGIILIHELGHFLVARACGMDVPEFSIGMGPRIFKIQGKKTLYSFKLLPIGGSVSLGEDMESESPTAFVNKPVWQRMLVIVAGAIMNLILGFIVCIFSVCTTEKIATTQVSGFYKDSVSSEQLMLGDEIVEIGGMPIWTTMDISYCFQNKAAETDNATNTIYFDMKVKRQGETLVLKVPFALNTSEDRTSGMIVDFTVQPQDKTFGNVISAAFRTALTESRLIWISLIDLLTGTYGINDMSGPIGVVTTMSTAYSTMGLETFLTLVALITLNLGIFNLLPIPALDGARFIFLIIEAIRGKRIPPEKEGMVHFIGFALLMILMLIVTFNDIVKLFTGGFSL